MNWFLAALNKYADFSGRAQRSEYWYFYLFYILIYLALAIVAALFAKLSENASIGVSILMGLFALGMLVPSIAVGVRRLHDTDRSGWWLLIGLIPIVGGIVLLIFCVQDSQPDANRFGPNPKLTALENSQ